MTQRKPPGTSWESWIDAQIRVAQEQGAFDNLPGAGKPLPDIDREYDPLWWVKQLTQREQISLLPPSLELLRKVEKELATLEKLGRSDGPSPGRRAQRRDRQGQRDHGGGAADAPRQAGRRSGRGAVAAEPFRHAAVAAPQPAARGPPRAGGASRQSRSDTADRGGATTGRTPVTAEHRCRVPRSCLAYGG